MFLRIRGQGASPENSQAALLHLRGFRHTHTQPIACSYLASSPSGPASLPDASRPFVFAHFPMGILSPETLPAQVTYLHTLAKAAADAAQTSGSADATRATAAATAALADPSAAVLHSVSDETQRMVWKETWNVYDIVYDEVPLLPAAFDATNALLKALRQAERDGATKLTSSALELPKDYVRPLATSGKAQVLVSTHYFCAEAIPLEKWGDASMAATPTRMVCTRALPYTPVVAVVDLSGVDPASAFQKLALELAWSTAYATTQADNPLLRAAAIVVRLPYEEVPSSTHWMAQHAPTNAACAAVLEAYDFIGQHLSLLYQGLLLGAPALLPLLAATWRGPPVHIIGTKTRLEEDAALQALLGREADKASETAGGAEAPAVVLLGCDTNPNLAASAEKLAEAWDVPVSVLIAPVKALIDGGEEPWDPYTQKERERLNFCPCCGDCDHTHEASESSHGHGHGYGHGH